MTSFDRVVFPVAWSCFYGWVVRASMCVCVCLYVCVCVSLCVCLCLVVTNSQCMPEYVVWCVCRKKKWKNGKMKNRDSLARKSHFKQLCGGYQAKNSGGQFISLASC